MTKATAPKFKGKMSFVVDVSAAVLIELAERDCSHFEDFLDDLVPGGGTFTITPEEMLANPLYMASLKKRVTKMVTENVSYTCEDLYIGGRDIKSIFKAEIKTATDKAKKVTEERKAAFEKSDPSLLTMLNLSKHDAEKVRNYLNRNNIEYAEAPVATKPNAVVKPPVVAAVKAALPMKPAPKKPTPAAKPKAPAKKLSKGAKAVIAGHQRDDDNGW